MNKIQLFLMTLMMIIMSYGTKWYTINGRQSLKDNWVIINKKIIKNNYYSTVVIIIH